MDDLLLFISSKQSHIVKLEDLLKALFKNGLKYQQRNVNYLEQNYNIWIPQYLYRIGEFVLNH